MAGYQIPMDDLTKLLALARKAAGQEQNLRNGILIAYEEHSPEDREAGCVDWEMEASAIAPALANLEALVEYLCFPESRRLVTFVEGPDAEPAPEKGKLTMIIADPLLLERLGGQL